MSITPTNCTGREIIDADGHIWEEPQGIIERLPAPYRADFLRNPIVAEHFLFPPLDHFHTMPVRVPVLEERTSNDIGPAEWLAFLDEVGIARTVMYPTRALALGQLRDPDFAVALCDAYNEWLADRYVSHEAGRFHGVAIVPMQAPERAAAVLRRAVEDLGLTAAMIPANGLPRHLGAPECWPVYEEAERLGCPLSFHGGSHSGLGFDDLNVYAPVHALGHPFGLLIALAALVFNRVYERFPGLRTAFLEGGSAWLLLALERFTESGKAFPDYDRGGNVLSLPSDTAVDDHILDLLHEGRLVVGCEGGEHDLAYVTERVGRAPFMYSSDFPHEVDAQSCAHELKELDELALPRAATAAILAGNARAFYGLPS
jgi:predicted TIM-barrel fold metal-dependent hydrolase